MPRVIMLDEVLVRTLNSEDNTTHGRVYIGYDPRTLHDSARSGGE